MATKATQQQEIANTLIGWYAQNSRDLPWRHTRDPYNILVSEIMLQQTQVSRVIDKYHEWLESFPGWQTLAQASQADVITHWAGLGYNRRALALHNIAKHIVEYGEPKNREAWMKLKGIGPYTSAAVATFAQHERVLPIDTNIRRVLGRALLGMHFPQISDDVTIESEANTIMHTHDQFYNLPQAIFDLSNAHCASKNPTCGECPLKQLCVSSEDFIEGRIEIPKRTIKKSKEFVREGKKHPNRIYRGRILKIVREAQKPITNQMLGEHVDPNFDPIKDQEWIDELVEKLVKDQLIEQSEQYLTLPQ